MTLSGLLIHCNSCGHERELQADYVQQISMKLSLCVSALTVEDLLEHLHKFRCSNCGAKEAGLVFPRSDRDDLLSDSQLAKTCAFCGKPIRVERMEAVPDTETCISCQERLERQEQTKQEPIYCKRCGARMVWRVRKAVLPTQYFLGCSNFPKCKYAIFGSW